MIAVPERLEDRVVEAEAQQVLHRLLAEIVIDPVELVFPDRSVQRGVEGARARQIVTEGLLDHDPPPRL